MEVVFWYTYYSGTVPALFLVYVKNIFILFKVDYDAYRFFVDYFDKPCTHGYTSN